MIKEVSVSGLENKNKDSNEAKDDNGELDKATSKYQQKIKENICDTTKNVENKSEEEIETNRMHLKCDFCEYKCKKKKTLTKHKTKNHGDQNKCFICDTRFYTAETLKTHEDMHTDDEMFDSLNRLCDSVTNQ